MIDLVAQGPVYRGHKLSRIVEEFCDGYDKGEGDARFGWIMPEVLKRPVSTKSWARLDVRVLGNPWGLSVSELPDDYDDSELDLGDFF